MAAVRKIALSSSRDIPFNKLVLSQSNVRKIKAVVSAFVVAAGPNRDGVAPDLGLASQAIERRRSATGNRWIVDGLSPLAVVVRRRRLVRVVCEYPWSAHSSSLSDGDSWDRYWCGTSADLDGELLDSRCASNNAMSAGVIPLMRLA